MTWDARAPYRGWVSFHRLTKAVGFTAEPTGAQPSPDATPHNAGAPNGTPTPFPINVVTDHGTIVDITRDTNHEQVILLLDEQDGVRSLKTVAASLFPAPIVQQAALLKRMATAPGQAGAGVQTRSSRATQRAQERSAAAQ